MLDSVTAAAASTEMVTAPPPPSAEQASSKLNETVDSLKRKLGEAVDPLHETLVSTEQLKDGGKKVKVGSLEAPRPMTFEPQGVARPILTTPHEPRSVPRFSSLHQLTHPGASELVPLPAARTPSESSSRKKFSKVSRNRWTPAEVKNLVDGLQEFGYGSWKDIRAKYFAGSSRSTVDLKDKARNLDRERTKNGQESYSSLYGKGEDGK